MSWDQTVATESVHSFLTRQANIDVMKLVEEEAARRGIVVKSHEVVDAEDDADGFGAVERPALQRVTLQDGSVFVLRLVRTESWDDGGVDYYEYRPEKEVTKVARINHND